jgi:hypothetical protein
LIQNTAPVPKWRPSRSAVSALMPRLPAMISLSRYAQLQRERVRGQPARGDLLREDLTWMDGCDVEAAGRRMDDIGCFAHGHSSSSPSVRGTDAADCELTAYALELYPEKTHGTIECIAPSSERWAVQ